MLALLGTIDLILNLYSWVLIITAILSWLIAFNIVNPYSEVILVIGRFAAAITEPLLSRIRQILPQGLGVDLSPVVVLIAIYFLRQFIWTSILPAILK